jgi:hypothetical protein
MIGLFKELSEFLDEIWEALKDLVNGDDDDIKSK